MTTGRVRGRLPSHLDLPAFPERSKLKSLFETEPIVALQVVWIILTSPDGIFNVANRPSRATN
jgi:hypothetical protein